MKHFLKRASALIAFLITALSGYGQLGDITARSLGALGGTNNDTTVIQRGVTNASARGVALDLQGGTYRVTQLVIDRTVRIRNGTITAFAAHTNTWGFVSITNGATGVHIDNVVFDGANLVLNVARIHPGVHGTLIEKASFLNALQPALLDWPAAGVMVNENTSGTMRGVTVSNIVAVANGTSDGSDSMGACAALLFITSATNWPAPRWLIENAVGAEVKSSGSSEIEDSDTFRVHRFGDHLTPIVFKDSWAINPRKRMFKLMADGVTLDGFGFSSTADNTNWTMYAVVSGYAGALVINNGRIPSGAWIHGLDIINNQSPMAGLTIQGNQIGVGTNTLVGKSGGVNIQVGIRFGGSYGTSNAVVSGNVIGSEWAKPIVAIQSAGGNTNVSIQGNIGWASSVGIQSGWLYTGEQTWGTNRFERISGNIIMGSPSFAGIRAKKTADLALGGNSLEATVPYYFDNGWEATVRTEANYGQGLIGGYATNLVYLHVGPQAGLAFGSGDHGTNSPLIMVAGTTQDEVGIGVGLTNVNARRIQMYARTNGYGFSATYGSGGNQGIFFSEANVDMFWIYSGGSVLSSHLYPNSGNTYDLGRTATRWQNGYINTLESSNITVNPVVYGAGWNGNTNVPTRDDVYDKIETITSISADRHTAYAAGTAYSLTATPALLDYGTTDPTITISTAGTYLIQANVGLKYNGATFAGNQSATVKLRRTNNTPADITSASRSVTLSIVTGLTGSVETTQIPPVFYTASAGDIIQVFGSVSATPSAGSVDSDSAEIIALRIQ